MSQRTIFRMNFTLNHCPSNMSPAKWAKERAFYTWNGAYSAKDYMFASNKLLKDRTHNDYMAKSTGIFNLTHQLSSDEVEVYKQSIQNTSSHIWHPIISLNDEMSAYINDPNEAAHFLDYALSPLWTHSQLKKEKVNVVAGLHKDTDNRHMHISIWEKDNVKENTFWGNIPQRALDEVVVKSAYYFSEKKYQLHKARDKAIDALKEFCPSVREWQNQRYSDSVRHKLYKLAKELPSTGRLQYNSIFMKPFRQDIDTLVNYIVSSDHTLRSAYDDYLCAINGVSKELSDIMKESKVKTFKSANDTDMVKNIKKDIKARMGNYILKIAKELKNEPRFNYTKLPKQGTGKIAYKEKTIKDTEKQPGLKPHLPAQAIAYKLAAKRTREMANDMLKRYQSMMYDDLAAVKSNYIYDYLHVQHEKEMELREQHA